MGEPAFAHLLEPLLAYFGVDTPELIKAVSFFVAFFVISYLHIVVGELAPKSWAIRKPELLSLWTAVPLYLFYWLMYPAIYLLNASANTILRIAGQGEPGPHHEHHYSREELKLILHSSRGQDPSDQGMRVLASAVEMGELEVVDWANSREDMVIIDAHAPLKQILALIRRHKFSRYPVYDTEREEFTGLLHIKDLLLELAELEHLPETIDLEDLARPLERVSRHMPLSQLLEQFRKGGAHFVLVEEADGKVIGYLTMEDVLEVLVATSRTNTARPSAASWPISQESCWARRYPAVQGRALAGRGPGPYRGRNTGRPGLRNAQARTGRRRSARGRRAAHHRQEDERPQDRAGQSAQAGLSYKTPGSVHP